MAINIVVSDLVKFKVKGTINDEHGIAKPFDFWLTCERLESDDLSAKIKSDGNITEFMVDVVRDWDEVRDASGQKIPFSQQVLRTLFAIPGVAFVSYRAYTTEVGAKEKN